MPLVGEQAWHAWAYTFGGNYYSASWELNFAPSPKFIKVFLGSYYEFEDKSAVAVGLIKMRFRLPNNQDQTVNFPNIDALDPVMVQFHNTMTHVTFGIKVKHAYGLLVWTLGHWA